MNNSIGKIMDFLIKKLGVVWGVFSCSNASDLCEWKKPTKTMYLSLCLQKQI